MKKIISDLTNTVFLPPVHYKKATVLLLIIFAVIHAGYAQENFPVPPASASQLFYLQRTPNTNTIVYELNLKNGVPDADNPVHAFWLRYQEKGQQEELSYIQRKFAYGI